MKKKAIWLLLYLVFLVVFNIIFFLVGDTRLTGTAWSFYGFIHFAYFMLILTPLFARKDRNEAVYKFSLYSAASLYFIIELALGIIFIYFVEIKANLALTIQLILAGIYLITFFSHLIANKRTEESDVIKQTERNYIKAITIELENLARTVKEPEIKNKIEKVYDAVKSSPTKSDASVITVENEIRGEISRLRNLIENDGIEGIDSVVERLINLIKQRNSQLKLLN